MSLLEYYDENDPGTGRSAQSRSREFNTFRTAVLGLIIDLLKRALGAGSLRDLCGKLDDMFGAMLSEATPVASASDASTEDAPVASGLDALTAAHPKKSRKKKSD